MSTAKILKESVVKRLRARKRLSLSSPLDSTPAQYLLLGLVLRF
ncbi:hypothetical protein BSPLISOX_3311 [uncultured Gammaproteobacteria bacterium]|nr:hypothetical protein [uncultured Gammaproteobacteria bacterium]CAC9471713.1 hypothetical protein [uncultured Gammaproteobacteria bacterium]VVH67180.1 hypothetical protein BSPLISOX_3311 [uncultured Gammaproteobacteria bacterium]